MLNYPLGSTAALEPSMMINILGAEGYKGPARYEGLEEVLKMEHAFVHLYGKKNTAPGRKMGHVTLLDKDKTGLLRKATYVKQTLRVIS
jgi:5-(carboxyamino)imidazole ribonucleotide synthase